jgi:hypothetical protein
VTTSANVPQKYQLPWATNDTSKVEIPLTTSDATRASLSLGFPPLTMQPPESGGVPPQGEDFNGGMNQISRIAWWLMQGGSFPYDAAFATSASIGGYPNGATLPRADYQGCWRSTADNNTTNPDATDGSAANWVPLSVYGSYSQSTTGGTTTVYPVNAAFESITVTGTLTSNAVLVLPAWAKHWAITNSTTGAFSVTVKTASGNGAVIPQDGSPTDVYGDGTNINYVPRNIPAATAATHPVQLGQLGNVGVTPGRLLRTSVYYNNGGTLYVSLNGGAFAAAASSTFTALAATQGIDVEGMGAGGGSGGVAATGSAQYAATSGAQSGAYGRGYYTTGFNGAIVTCGAAGTAGAAGANAGGNGGTSSFGSLLTCPGGLGSAGVAAASQSYGFVSPSAGATSSASGGQINDSNASGTLSFGVVTAGGGTLSVGKGGDSTLGKGGPSLSSGGSAGKGYGGGASGQGIGQNTAATAGYAGAPGAIIVREYA